MSRLIKTTQIFFRKHALLKLIIALMLGGYLIFHNSPKMRDMIFYFIETQIFYREIPPVYNKENFKTMEPNGVCNTLADIKLNASSYARSHNFEFACESVTLVSPDSSWNIKYLVAGKIFNADTIVLKMEFLNEAQKYDSVKEMIPFVDHLFADLGYGNMPEKFRQGLYSLTDETVELSNNVSVKLIASKDSISLIFY